MLQSLIALPKNTQVEPVTPASSNDKDYAYNMVRTDHTERKLDQYLVSDKKTDNEVVDTQQQVSDNQLSTGACAPPECDKNQGSTEQTTEKVRYKR